MHRTVEENKFNLIMKRHYIQSSLHKMYKRMAKINLTHLFNKSVVKSVKNKKKNFKNSYREKIKIEYHFQKTKCKYNGNHLSFAKTLNSIEFTDLNYPSLREKILNLSKVFANIPPKMNSNFTLIKSTSNYQIINMSSGRFLNFSILKSLNAHLKIHPNLNLNNSCLNLSIGMYIIKSTTNHGIEIPRYLIILGKIANLHHTTPNYSNDSSFIIAIYEGSFLTPTIANEILRPFVDEMKELLTTKNPIELFNGRKISRIALHAFIVDPIANSIFTCTSLPESLYGCSKCNLNGQLQFNHNITSFPAYCKTENLRLDEDFKYCLDNGYHLGVPIMMELNVGLVSQTSIDYKYTVCMGVMKRLITLWTTGKLDYRINKKSWLRILDHLELISHNCPKEFRNPAKYSDDLNTWDAYDWKQFLIYFGPIVLENNLPQRFYVHFLCLHLAARCMINQYKSRKYRAFIVGFLLKYFVYDFAILYGEDLIDYNVHNLIHFEDTISQLGSIESVGGFMFEDQFDFINKLIQNNQNISIEEIAVEILTKINSSVPSRNILSICEEAYYVDYDMNLIFDNFLFNNQHPDNYILTTKGIFQIQEIINNYNKQILIVGKKFEIIRVLFQAPLTDEKLVSVVETNNLEIITLSEIITKLIKYEIDTGLFMMPLIRPS